MLHSSQRGHPGSECFGTEVPQSFSTHWLWPEDLLRHRPSLGDVVGPAVLEMSCYLLGRGLDWFSNNSLSCAGLLLPQVRWGQGSCFVSQTELGPGTPDKVWNISSASFHMSGLSLGFSAIGMLSFLMHLCLLVPLNSCIFFQAGNRVRQVSPSYPPVPGAP